LIVYGKAGANTTQHKEETKDEGDRVRFLADYWVGDPAGDDEAGRLPQLNQGLGLAVEPLPEGVDLKALWQIII